MYGIFFIYKFRLPADRPHGSHRQSLPNIEGNVLLAPFAQIGSQQLLLSPA